MQICSIILSEKMYSLEFKTELTKITKRKGDRPAPWATPKGTRWRGIEQDL